MHEYTYKGCIVKYEVTALPPLGFQGTGYVQKQNAPNVSLKDFQTEASSAREAEQQIKKLIEDYIDFEFDQFMDNHDEL